jgi:hypothetical protein
MWKRVTVVVLSGWVLFSAIIWPSSLPNQVNNTVVGAGLLVFGTLSFMYEWARNVTLALAIWLFAFAALFGRVNPAMFWNDAMVAVVVFVLSLVGGENRRPLRGARPIPGRS